MKNKFIQDACLRAFTVDRKFTLNINELMNLKELKNFKLDDVVFNLKQMDNLFEISETNNISVEIKLQICHDYNNKNCNKVNCRRFHICEKIIA